MKTYQELIAQAESLLAEAEKLKQKEKAAAIAAMTQQIADLGISAENLGFVTPIRRPRRSTPTEKKAKIGSPVKYRGPNGEAWSGGRGRKPQWVVDVLAAGRKLEDFLV